jgi:folate-dependent phosphoribosylglycinamide formyltransferase PurN
VNFLSTFVVQIRHYTKPQTVSRNPKNDSTETIAAKVLALEHRYFAEVIESLL